MRITAFCYITFLISGFLGFGQEVIWNPDTPFTTENISAISSRSTDTIIIKDVLRIDKVVEVPAHLTLKFLPKAKLRISNEESFLIVNGGIDAGLQEIFDLSADGVTSYGFESISNITLKNTKVFFPEWWGVFPNIIPGINGDTKSKARHHLFLKEMMLDVAASGGGEVRFSEGVYYIRDIVIDSDNITVRGEREKTILRFDRDNYKFSTRRGGIFTIQGPTTEKYYNKTVPQGIHVAGNFRYDTLQKTIDNIVVKDLSIEWHIDAAKEDPSMNGLTIVNATNVIIDNVHVNLFGANRAFYIGTIFDGDITENIVIKNSSCRNSRTGVFVLHGYDSNNSKRREMALGNITISNNHFKVVEIPEVNIQHEHIVEKYLDKYASGIYFIGNEYTSDFIEQGREYVRNIGLFIIENNIIENADFGIRSWIPNKDVNKNYIHDVRIVGNTFINFRYTGIFSPFKTAVIEGNIFNSDFLSRIPKEVYEANEEEHIASSIHIAKAPWKVYRSKNGPDDVIVSGNTINGCFDNTTPIVVQPNEKGTVKLDNNIFQYDSSCIDPQFDMVITTNRRKFRTKRATIILSNNREINPITTNQSPSRFKLDVRRKRLINLLQE